jgi:hypothetical protein
MATLPAIQPDADSRNAPRKAGSPCNASRSGYPPMQAGASFNVGDLKEKVQQAIAASKAANQ